MYLAKIVLSAFSAVALLTPIIPLSVLNPGIGQALLKKWLQLQWRIFEIVVEVEYEEPIDPKKNYLFVQLNQVSLVDTLIIPALIPTYFRAIINIEYALIPWLGWCWWALGSLVLIRQRPEQAKKKMRKGTNLLRQGTSLFVAIEGQRSKDGQLLPFKKGPAVLAIDSQAPMIPIIIKGSREISPWGSRRISPGRVKVTFLRPVLTAGLSYEDRDTLTFDLRNLAEKRLVN